MSSDGSTITTDELPSTSTVVPFFIVVASKTPNTAGIDNSRSTTPRCPES